MKAKGTESGKWEEPEIPESMPDIEPKDAKGKKWWHYVNIEKMKPLLPTLRNPQGTKREVRYHTFLETWTACQELFERNRYIFRTRNQVDFLAHYIGAKILLEAWGKEGVPKSDLYVLLEKQEYKRSLYDDMKHVKILVVDLIEKHAEGFVSEEELTTRCKEYIDAFKNPRDKEIVARVIDKLFDSGEIDRATARIRKRKSREFEKTLKGLQGVAEK